MTKETDCSFRLHLTMHNKSSAKFRTNSNKNSRSSGASANRRGAQTKSPEKAGEIPGYKIGLTVAFFLFLAAAATTQRLAWQILPAYLLLSLVGYGAYTMDKRAARLGQWRISETRLHVISLLGGWPGALLAQSRLRHKRGKPGFMLVFWCTVIANLGLLALAVSAAFGGMSIRGAF
jgi:uncharacterized membrane protein YsdA (DUF1294 family)